ncbi:hypothetical protein OGATHE_000536 [Ogataea polymorpha]|uniref:Uncharacterized protein n=1 Tax=Ogataea polymorpha TaxID=460523 RepID=A0A9P8PT55_9ASCO|nr:hypothetical protein OGATHE_000536 [Ogataea polymorpha]
MDTSAPAERASMKALVPDLAMVPRFLTNSALVIPIPESLISRIFCSGFGVILMKSSGSVSSTDGSDRAWYLILSSASEAFEINSLRKISLFEYTVLMNKDIN